MYNYYQSCKKVRDTSKSPVPVDRLNCGYFMGVVSVSFGLIVTEITTLIVADYESLELITTKQLTDIFGKFLEENPARKYQSFTVLFLDSMIEAFPQYFKCPVWKNQ